MKVDCFWGIFYYFNVFFLLQHSTPGYPYSSTRIYLLTLTYFNILWTRQTSNCKICGAFSRPSWWTFEGSFRIIILQLFLAPKHFIEIANFNSAAKAQGRTVRLLLIASEVEMWNQPGGYLLLPVTIQLCGITWTGVESRFCVRSDIYREKCILSVPVSLAFFLQTEIQRGMRMS